MFKFLADLFNPEELQLYMLSEFPFNVVMLREAVDKKLAEDPEYEVFVPVVYYKYEQRLKDKSIDPIIRPHKWFVSNKGRLLSTRNNKQTLLTTSDNSSDYVQTIVKVNQKSQSLVLHRIVACVFVPPAGDFIKQHPKDLEVNHLDGIKSHCWMENLEWGDGGHNHQHALKHNLRASGENHPDTKPIKATVVRGPHKGLEFLLIGKTHMIGLGFDQAAVSNALSGNLLTHRNCSYVYATEEEIASLPRELPDEVIESLKEIEPNAQYLIVGENELTGERVEAIGDKHLRELGFNPSAVRNVLSGRSKTHKGYTWRKENFKAA